MSDAIANHVDFFLKEASTATLVRTGSKAVWGGLKNAWRTGGARDKAVRESTKLVNRSTRKILPKSVPQSTIEASKRGVVRAQSKVDALNPLQKVVATARRGLVPTRRSLAIGGGIAATNLALTGAGIGRRLNASGQIQDLATAGGNRGAVDTLDNFAANPFGNMANQLGAKYQNDLRGQAMATAAYSGDSSGLGGYKSIPILQNLSTAAATAAIPASRYLFGYGGANTPWQSVMDNKIFEAAHRSQRKMQGGA